MEYLGHKLEPTWDAVVADSGFTCYATVPTPQVNKILKIMYNNCMVILYLKIWLKEITRQIHIAAYERELVAVIFFYNTIK